MAPSTPLTNSEAEFEDLLRGGAISSAILTVTAFTYLALDALEFRILHPALMVLGLVTIFAFLSFMMDAALDHRVEFYNWLGRVRWHIYLVEFGISAVFFYLIWSTLETTSLVVFLSITIVLLNITLGITFWLLTQSLSG